MSGRRWTEHELAKLRAQYPDALTANIAARLGRTLRQVYGMANRLGLKKSGAFLASAASGRLDGLRGSQSRFCKGQTPWNKGQKGLACGGRDTQYQPGQMPHNHVPVGTVVTSSDGYLKIKTAEPKTWRWLHRQVWEDANGPIPRGMALIFRDGNREHCTLDNLQLISRSELMSRNTIHRYPQELKNTLRLVGKLRRTINDRQNHK